MYYSPNSFAHLKNKFETRFSILHNNVQSLRQNFDRFQTHLPNELDFPFDVIGLTKTKIAKKNSLGFHPPIAGYNFEYVPTTLASGGVGMYINNEIDYTILESASKEAFQALWIEINFSKSKNIICGVIYHQ